MVYLEFFLLTAILIEVIFIMAEVRSRLTGCGYWHQFGLHAVVISLAFYFTLYVRSH